MVSHSVLHRFALAAIGVSLATACYQGDGIAGPGSESRAGATGVRSTLAATSITSIDLSNGSGLTGNARSISGSGIILGYFGGQGVWWKSPSPVFASIGSGGVNGGNRNADAGTQGAVILSSAGGVGPWTVKALQAPSGIAVNQLLARDINDSRVVVGSTLGSNIYALRWPTTDSPPESLPVPALQYPAQQVVAYAVNNLGVIVGFAYEGIVNNVRRDEALVWSGQSVMVLPLAAGATAQRATNINDAGVISGYIDANRTSYPVRWTPRTGGGYDVAVLNLSAKSFNLYTGIDRCGRIAGGSDQGGFVWDGAAVTILPSPAGSSYGAEAYDINESGEAVGESVVGTSKGRLIFHPTLWQGMPPCP